MSHSDNGNAPPWPQPRPETEHTNTFIIEVEAFGHPEQTIYETAKTLGRSMTSAFTPGTWKITTPDGKKVIYDALAYDGEHGATHKSVVTFE